MQAKYRFIFVSLLIVSLILLFSLNFFVSNKNFICGDGTFYGNCSTNLPYFCEEGILIPRASLCSCAEGLKIDLEKCNSNLSGESKISSFYYTLKGQKESVEIELYEEVVNYLSNLPKFINFNESNFPVRKDFELKKINEPLQRESLLPLIVAIQNLAPDSKTDQARISVSLVQNIEYSDDFENISYSEIEFPLKFSYYPYQTLYFGKGACESKSELTVFLLKELGFGTALFYFPELNHQAAGIKCPLKKSFRKSGYCFIETTSPSPISFSKGGYFDKGVYSEIYGDFELIIVSEGDSLEPNLKEYSDSKFLAKVFDEENINFIQLNRLNKIRERYGLEF